MIVYIESNFVIELARQQNQYAGCEGILSLAEANRIKLVIPAFALEEPYGTWGRKLRAREKIIVSLGKEYLYLYQSEVYRDKERSFDEVNQRFERYTYEERQRLNTTISRIFKAAVVVPLTHEILNAAAFYQEEVDLSPPDSVMCAAVLSDLANAPENIPKCFVNKNYKDFSRHGIRTKLENQGCKLMRSFNQGFNYIKSQV